MWNRIPDLRQSAAEVDDRLCLSEEVCSLINDKQLKCTAFNGMAMMKPTDGNMQVMHVNKALLTQGLVLQRRNSNLGAVRERNISRGNGFEVNVGVPCPARRCGGLVY